MRLPAGGRFVGGLLAALAVLTGFAGVATHVGLAELKDRDLRRAEMKAQDLALAASLAVGNSIDKIDISLRTVAAELERHPPADPAQRGVIAAIVNKQFNLIAESEDFSITDAAGTVVFHEGARRPSAFSIADRPYFAAVAGGQPGLVISPPLISRLTGKPVLVFARPYRRPDGSFGGAVIVPAQITHFQRMMSGYALGANDRLGLWADALAPIAPPPGPEGWTASPELRAFMHLNVVGATFRETDPADGAARIVSIRRLAETRLYAVAAIAESDTLADWRGLRFAALAVLAAFLTLAYCGAWALHRMWTRRRRHAQDLAASNRQLAATLGEVRLLDAALVAARDVGGLGTFSLAIDADVWTPSPEQAAIFGLGDAYPRTRGGWDALIHPADLAAVHAYFAERRQETEFDLEYRIHRPCDGAERWIHAVGRIQPVESGTLLVGAVKDITDAKLSRDRIEYLALHDDLTHLPNRVLLADRMRQALASRCDGLLAVCYLDLDGFKPINDTWGHDLGDALLVEVARRLEARARVGDTVARMGGDEFVVLLCGVADAAELEGVARRMLDSIGQPYRIGDIPARLSASIGISVHPRDPAAEPDALIRQADQAMYEAKRKGRNRFHIYDAEGDRRLREHQAHASRMAEALEAGEFRLHFQPRVDLRSGAVDGVEALLRWQHPERGLLPPAAFLPGIEDTDLAAPLGEWILRTALRQRQAWRDAGLDLTVAVNVFGTQLQDPEFALRLAEILAEFPALPPSGLELEIVETTVMRDLPVTARRLAECTRLGVRFALDDFGTGYASLTYFRSLPVSLLKIDRSFIADILVNPGDQALVQSVVAMAHAFGRTVVAEGVETLAHGRSLLRYGCDLAQGFGVARPMPAEAVAPWAAAWRMPEAWRLGED